MQKQKQDWLSSCMPEGGRSDRFDGRQPVARGLHCISCACRARGKAADSRRRRSSNVHHVRPRPARARPRTRRITTGPNSTPHAGCSRATPRSITAQRRLAEGAVQAAEAVPRRHTACVRAPCAVCRALPHHTAQPSRPGADANEPRSAQRGLELLSPNTSDGPQTTRQHKQPACSCDAHTR